MFVETGKKFMESFSELKNQKPAVLVTQNVADDVSGAFYRFGLS